MNDWLKNHLVCPRDKKELVFSENKLICPEKHTYPVFEDIPVMLVNDVEITHEYINQTLQKIAGTTNSEAENALVQDTSKVENEIDPFVQGEIPYTSGNLYFSVQNKLTRYPIPECRLPVGSGQRLLDIGCNWGRWSIAAAQKGYRPIGIDPSLNAILAARFSSSQAAKRCRTCSSNGSRTGS